MGSYDYGMAPMKYSTMQRGSYAQHAVHPQQREFAQDGGYVNGSRQRHHGFRGWPQQSAQLGGQNGFQSGGVHGRPNFGGFGQQNVAWGGGAHGGFGGWQRLTSAQHADRMFGQFDTNGDGQITRDEMIAAFDAMRGAAASAATASTDATTTATFTDTTSTDVLTTAPTTETTIDASADTTSTDAAAAEAALAELLADTDTSTVDVPVAPTVTDDSAGTSVV